MSKTTLCILLAAVLVPVAVIEARPHARPVRARVAQSEVSIDRDIQLRSTAERTVAWVDANKAAMRRAAGIEVLQDFGNGKVKVRKINTSKGNFVWIAQETLEVKDGVYTFKSTRIPRSRLRPSRAA